MHPPDRAATCRKPWPPKCWQLRSHWGSRQRLTASAGLSAWSLAKWPSRPYICLQHLSHGEVLGVVRIVHVVFQMLSDGL